MKSNCFHKTALLLALLAFTTGLAYAQGDTSQLKLYVVKVEMSGEVTLAWAKRDSLVFTKFYVWMAVNGPAQPVPGVIDSTSGSATTIEIKLPPPPVGGEASYSLFVVGIRPDGSRVNSNGVTVELEGVHETNAFRLEAQATDGGRVRLRWTRPVQVTVQLYSVYRAPYDPMHSQPSAPAVQILSTTDTSAIDSTIASPGYYVYYVVAQVSSTTSLTSTYAFVFVGNRPNVDAVKFVSTPVTTARAGVAYSYKAMAVSSDSTATIRYFLGFHPEIESPSLFTMKIDSVTGELTFTPSQRGRVGVRILARSSKGGYAVQEFVITVSGGNGILTGKTTDTLDHPIARVLIQVFKREVAACFSYHTTTDSLGNYRFTDLDPGSYYVHAIPLSGDFADQWFDGKNSPLEATPILVADSPSVAIANFKLRNRVAPSVLKGTVSGQVQDTLGLAVTARGTVVVFVRADFALNDGDDFRRIFDFNESLDHRLDGDSKFVFATKVDSTGHYSIRVPTGKYIAFAKSPGYSIDFYKGHSDILSADIITVFPDIAVPPALLINFTLAPLPPVLLGKISGTVRDTVKNVGVRSRLIAFRDRWTVSDSSRFRFQRTYVTDTDSVGQYTFSDLLPGRYIILAVPLGRYVPVFYSTGTQSLRWKNATRITINGNSVTGIDIYVKAMSDSSDGFTFVGGKVSVGSGSSAPGLVGAIVFASNAAGNIVGYGVTDVGGNYTISGIAPRSYSVSADIPGYDIADTRQVNPTYSAGFAVPGSASFAAQAVTDVTVPPNSSVPTEYTLEQNFPNPFNPSTTIDYSLPGPSRVTLKVYNLIGQHIATLVDGQQQAGKYQVIFSRPQLASGVYFYQLQVGSNVVLTRKMLLLK